MNSFLESNLANFVWGLAAFVVFVLVLFRVAGKQVLTAVQAREDAIGRQMKEAEDAYARAKKVQSDLDARFAAAEAKIAELMAQARQAAEQHRAELVEKGRVDIEGLRQRSLAEIESARNTALASLRTQIAEIAVAVSEKVIHERLDAARHDALVGEAIDAYSRKGGA
jgi:F-type H+-transporting ATPase subunit b